MKKRAWILIGLAVSLLACHASSTSTPTTTREGYYSNTGLTSKDWSAHPLPLSTSLLNSIRAKGGEVYQSGNFVTLVIPADALFEPGTSVLLPKAEATISDVASVIAKFPGENVIITTHTDNVGGAYSSALLSGEQAHLFAMILWQQDVIDHATFERFRYAGLGATQPVTQDPSAYGQAINRRVQVTIYPSDDMEKAYQQLGDATLYPV